MIVSIEKNYHSEVKMFNKLDYVYAVYKERNFTRAAEKLFISQPSLSAAIKNIENKLGAPLFDRSGSVITLTEVGEEYIRAAERIMSIKAEFMRRVGDIYNLETGHITVGGTNYLSSYVLPRIINRFASLYPKIEVTLTEANSHSLNEMIQKEEVDIIIDSFDRIPEDLEGYPLTSERILLCVPSDRKVNEALAEYRISPDEIYNGREDFDGVKTVPIEWFKEENFVLLKSGNDMYGRAMRIFEEAGITPKVSFSVDQMNISYALADSGMGLCFLTDTLFRFGKFKNNVFLYKIGGKYSNRTLYVAHKKNKYCPRATEKFISAAEEVVRRGRE